MSHWRCTYQGRPDSESKSGHAAPSWHTFDRRVWRRGDYEIELINLHRAPPRRIATYQITLRGPRGELLRVTGFNWQRIVREVKTQAP